MPKDFKFFRGYDESQIPEALSEFLLSGTTTTFFSGVSRREPEEIFNTPSKLEIKPSFFMRIKMWWQSFRIIYLR